MRGKFVNESINDLFVNKDLDQKTTEKWYKSLADKLDTIKTHVEAIIEETNNYFSELESEGIEVEDLDVDDMEAYISNESANNVAQQILNIINES